MPVPKPCGDSQRGSEAWDGRNITYAAAIPWNLPRSGSGTISAKMISVTDKLPPLPIPWIAVMECELVPSEDVIATGLTSTSDEHGHILSSSADHGADGEKGDEDDEDIFAPETRYKTADERQHGG